MTFFSSLAARRLALLVVMFVIGVACAKVERNYADGPIAGAENGGSDSVGGAGGTAGSGTIGKAGSAADAGASGSAGESAAGAAGEAGGSGAGNPSLRVNLTGDGEGKVTSDLPGIDCGTTCSAEFDPDTEVVLTATPAANSTFTGWSGGGCSGTGTCTTVISSPTTVRAIFTSIKVTLTVALAGTGVGVVKSTPAGIDCGTTCTLAVPVGGSVQLTATPATGSVFAGWSGGGCSGTGTCTTTVNAAAAVAATFTLTPMLTVVKAGTGLGVVTSVPAGINCGADCSEAVTYGSVVTLSAAVTGTGSVFTGWSGGGCTGTGACVVTVTAATQVTATFTCSTGTVTLNYTGAITSYTVPSCVTALTIDAYGAQGGNAGSYLGGYGARIKGTVAVSGGAVLKVLVGGRGVDAFDTAQQAGGSGGGGTFVTNAANSALIVAGGGGGAMNYTPSWLAAGLGGTTTTAGLAASSGGAAGGTAGGGGYTFAWTGWHTGTGGGGLTGNGIGNTTGLQDSYGTPYSPGMSFINGGSGGQPGSCAAVASGCIVGRAGGFGGGGAAGFTGGGGGGYSGGGGGNFVSGSLVGSGGGGGGSYNGGTAQTNTAGVRTGNGVVVFTY